MLSYLLVLINIIIKPCRCVFSVRVRAVASNNVLFICIQLICVEKVDEIIVHHIGNFSGRRFSGLSKEYNCHLINCTGQLDLLFKTSLSVREVWGSTLGLVNPDTVSPMARHSSNFSSALCCPGAKHQNWAPPLVTRFGVISSETSAPRTPQPGWGGAQKGEPVISQYVVLFTQRMIKVP